MRCARCDSRPVHAPIIGYVAQKWAVCTECNNWLVLFVCMGWLVWTPLAVSHLPTPRGQSPSDGPCCPGKRHHHHTRAWVGTEMALEQWHMWADVQIIKKACMCSMGGQCGINRSVAHSVCLFFVLLHFILNS